MPNNFISLIGFPRSGTTLIARNLSKFYQFAYWEEPKYIWKYRARPYFNDDLEQVPNDRTRHYILTRFLKFKGEKMFLLEKTPSNIFRIPYLNKLFPEMRYIYIYRKPLDVVKSYRIKNDGPVDWSVIRRRLRNRDIPLADIHLIIIEIIRVVFPLTRKGSWGIKIAHNRDYGKNDEVLFYWIVSAKNILSNYTPNRDFIMSYEEYITDVEANTKKIIAAMNLGETTQVISLTENRKKGSEVTDISVNADLLEEAQKLYRELNDLTIRQ